MSRLEKLYARRTDDLIELSEPIYESFKSINQSESVKYVIGAMQPIDPRYTRNTYKQAERVSDQLKNRLDERSCDFKYQGSVTNDTHIKAKSDIDLLVITGKFVTLEYPQVPPNPYKGNPVDDLLSLRADAETCLQLAFPKAEIDTSGNKSIAIEGGSLTRKVDVVPANWFETNEYSETNDESFLGVSILDKSVPTRITNTPFLHNARISNKDDRTLGGLRKACRLMKSLKYDYDHIDLSSYDIVSIAYNIPDEYLYHPKGSELKILAQCLSYCHYLINNQLYRDSIEVPDQSRKVFKEGHATLDGLQSLYAELVNLANDVINENHRSFKNLNEARTIDY
jgi:hypothetical protein